ncbi:MAG: zinc carboxypeptidase, partial [Bacteroidetes bacterium]|nr:zinc carboxypeptidase [Bacteroidota bacterium]
MKISISLLAFCLFINSCFVYGQDETYSKVRIHLENKDQISDLINSGLLIDHFTKSTPNSIDVELSTSDLVILSKNKLRYDVLIEDITRNYVLSIQNSRESNRGGGICGLQNFNYGTMGHYHTYDEILAQLDSMKSEYPNIITSKDSIGTTIEGRTIYAVKISDNPDSNEHSVEAAVYFDALHHAREPLSMEPLLYYMWWLLENYNIDAEATYIVNNRELYFIPIVNPDGYVYNELTNPNGGGLWRKNRRDNGGGNYGVDLNRNYSSAFGDNLGSSGDPASNSYRGDSAFSEPETRAVRDYILQADPSIAFTCHSSGQKFLVAPACFYPPDDYESYAEFASEFITNSFSGYGTTFEMLGY